MGCCQSDAAHEEKDRGFDSVDAPHGSKKSTVKPSAKKAARYEAVADDDAPAIASAREGATPNPVGETPVPTASLPAAQPSAQPSAQLSVQESVQSSPARSPRRGEDSAAHGTTDAHDAPQPAVAEGGAHDEPGQEERGAAEGADEKPEEGKSEEEKPQDVQLARPRNQQSLTQTAAELEQERALREQIKEETGGAVGAFDFVFDADEEDASPCADEEVACIAFEIDEVSPEKDLSLEPVQREAFDDRLPDPEWFEDRGALPPAEVVWYQTPDAVHAEITPANADVGYELRGGCKLCYNCTVEPAAEAAGADTAISMFTTSLTGSRRVRSACRDMQQLLELNDVTFETVDVADNAFLLKKAQDALADAMTPEELEAELAAQREADSEGQQAAVPLPLLFVGTRLVGTAGQLQALVDDDRLVARLRELGAAHVSGPASRRVANGVPEGATHRAGLVLLHPVGDAQFRVEGGALLVDLPKREPQYWAQLLSGPRPTYEKIAWIRRDYGRDVDDD